MNKLLLIIGILLIPIFVSAQIDNKKGLLAFTITGYIVNASDSIKVVQVQLPPESKAAITKVQSGFLSIIAIMIKMIRQKLGGENAVL